jgi:polysaccharide biosynthesis/export protein
MKIHLKSAWVVAGLVACLFILSKSALAQDPFQQDESAAQSTQDAGASAEPTEPNAQAGVNQVVKGGGMMGPDYLLGPEDVLTVTVLDLPQMTQTVRVENDGTINVKLLGRVLAAGLTTVELKKELEQDWGRKYLEDPIVSVFVKQYHSTPVSVVGAVARPGVYQLPGPRTLIQVIAMAGGVNLPGKAGSEMAGGAPAGRWAFITRRDGFGHVKAIPGLQQTAPDQVKVDLGKLLYSRDTALDIPVRPFDTVTISKAGIVYVVGDVRQSGGFTLENVDSLTALQALSLAQGCISACNMKRDIIIHTLPSGTRTQTYINLGRIMKGKAKDPILTANDMLIVPGSLGKGLLGYGWGTGLATLSGLIIWRGL